jgi:hypothetical protein
MIHQIILIAAVLFTTAHSQTQRLIINSYTNGPTTSTSMNGLGLPQKIMNIAQSFVAGNRLHIITSPNQAASYTTMLSSPQSCLSVPPQSQIDTSLVFKFQAPPGLDMTIVLATGTQGCRGTMNQTAAVRLSSFNNLNGQDAYVRIPLTAFTTGTNNYFNGRIRSVIFMLPSLSWPAHVQFGDMQLVARPRPIGLTSTMSNFVMQFKSGPPNQQWATVRLDGHCGPSYGWAGCDAGKCCSARGWCGTTPLHCLSVQSLLATM